MVGRRVCFQNDRRRQCSAAQIEADETGALRWQAEALMDHVNGFNKAVSSPINPFVRPLIDDTNRPALDIGQKWNRMKMQRGRQTRRNEDLGPEYLGLSGRVLNGSAQNIGARIENVAG